MANYTTSQDLVNDILTRGHELNDGTSDFDTDVVTYLNRAYLGLLRGGSELDPEVDEEWDWLRADDQGVLTLNPVIDTGTISVTNSSTTVTFSSAPTPSVAGRHFKVDDHADVFIISSHTATGTGATLESVYTGSTDTAASYRVMQLDYALASDVMGLSSQMTSYQDGRMKIKGVNLDIMDERWPKNELGSGVPHNFAMITDQSVRFSHYGGTSSTDLIKVDYEYLKLPSDLADDTNNPIVPREYRYILADWALSFLFAAKDDIKAGDAAALAQRGLRAMAKQNRRRMVKRSGGAYAKIQPRLGQVQRMMRPLRTESGLIITG
jgi:hypothetical protein